MEGKLIKTKTGFYLWRNPLDKSQEILGATVPIMNDNGVDLREYKLSLKNSQAIENGYDLDEMAEMKYSTTIDDFTDTGIDTSESLRLAYINGAKAILEILGDKKFSEDDIRKAIKFDQYHFEYGEIVAGKRDDEKEDFIQSLQQTEWDVEIEMQNYEPMYGEGVTQIPKLDADGCLILKRKI